MRKTKIVCTIGPKTCDYDSLKKLAEGGMNVARLNMSHGDHEWHRKVVKAIRTINEKLQYSVAIMVDTKGAEVRMGDLKDAIHLKKGDKMTFTERHQPRYRGHITEVSYDGFVEDVSVGDTILIDGGMITFKVKRKNKTDVLCECVDGGLLTSRRHINIRGKSARLPSITKRDWKDIDFAIQNNADFIALSFVKNAVVINKLKKYLEKKKAPIGVIAKIESADAIPQLEKILGVADGAIVARGDLGAEIPLEEVPLVQEDIVNICRQLGKPVIVATHLLESMIVHPTPTRAEVMDITEAVKERADSTMLSGETAAGDHPYKALSVMHTVAHRIEKYLSSGKKITVSPSSDPKEQIVMSAAIIGNNIEADAILVFTRRGFMAGLLSRTRPNSPIYAFTNTPPVRRKLNLYWGVTPYRIDFSSDPEKTIQRAITLLKSKKLLKKGSKIVIVSDILVGKEVVDTVQVRTIK